MEDMSVAEAAKALGVAEGTVKSRCSRGRAALAVLLRPRGAVPSGSAAGNRTRGPNVATPEVRPDPGPPTAATDPESW